MASFSKLPNQSNSAKRKLKNISKVSNIPLNVVTLLADASWDYDKNIRNESIGWIRNTEISADNLKVLADFLKVPVDFSLSFEMAISDLILAHKKINKEGIWSRFFNGVKNKDYCELSYFSSYYYIRGITRENVECLDWKGENVTLTDIAHYLFLKMFRGGAVDRYNLAYLWCDLILPFNALHTSNSDETLTTLFDAIDKLPENATLKDLLASCKGIMPGDKNFKKEVLQALCYSGVLIVNQINIKDVFIPEHRNILCSHYYSNEWSYPLRFWSENGGEVDVSQV